MESKNRGRGSKDYGCGRSNQTHQAFGSIGRLDGQLHMWICRCHWPRKEGNKSVHPRPDVDVAQHVAVREKGMNWLVACRSCGDEMSPFMQERCSNKGKPQCKGLHYDGQTAKREDIAMVTCIRSRLHSHKKKDCSCWPPRWQPPMNCRRSEQTKLKHPKKIEVHHTLPNTHKYCP